MFDCQLGYALGPSPRTRGKPCSNRSGSTWCGAIPAYAGETPIRPPSRLIVEGHPRVRGGNGFAWGRQVLQQGPSPRTRGKRQRDAQDHARLGAIPAYAGETARAWAERSRSRGHPRVRGGNLCLQIPADEGQGPSPRTRGKHGHGGRRRRRRGAIPAYAGETHRQSSDAHLQRGHPRVRGGNSTALPNCAASKGPSPRTRGKRGGLRAKAGCGGAIPAYAGETHSSHQAARAVRGHPRVRGGNQQAGKSGLSIHGPSPRTRGKHAHQHLVEDLAGAIPAYAGETARWPQSGGPGRGHPRVRGGNFTCSCIGHLSEGPSPRTRGKLARPAAAAARPGAIPAYAGETLRAAS